jgi:hypothetical protein
MARRIYEYETIYVVCEDFVRSVMTGQEFDTPAELVAFRDHVREATRALKDYEAGQSGEKVGDK